MTENNAAQPGLTDDQIEALAKKHIAPHADRLEAIMTNPVPYQQTEQFRRVKALIGDLLSKLRAEGVQAGDERETFEQAWKDVISKALGARTAAWLAWHERARRAALASAPVAGEAQEPVGEVFRHGEGRDENGPRVGIRMLPAAAGLPHGTRVYAAPQASEAVRTEALYLLREARALLPMFATAEAIGDWSEKVNRFAAGDVIDIPPQADKDGGDCAKGAGEALAPVFQFLLGEGPLRGVHFGERAPGAVGKWWWRQELRAALSPTPSVVKQSLTATQTGEKGESDAG